MNQGVGSTKRVKSWGRKGETIKKAWFSQMVAEAT